MLLHKRLCPLNFVFFREILLFPFVLLERLGQFDVEATTDGGGETGKVGAVRLATSKALCAFVGKEEIEKLRLGI